MASRKVPAFLTCSQVRVVKEARIKSASHPSIDLLYRRSSECHFGDHSIRLQNTLTAERSNRGVDRFDKNTLPMELQQYS